MKFQVFKKGALDKDFKLCGALMFGGDNIPLHNVQDISCADGIIETIRKSSESAGLTLLWPIEGFGNIMLSTTCLPEREKPYNLNLEIARAKLMQITLKREDWAVFDSGSSFENLLCETQELFIQSLQNINDQEKASVIADKCLKKAMILSEKLALKHGERFFAMRTKNKNLGKHSIGCEIDPQLMGNDNYLKWVFEMFGYVTIPVNWNEIEKEKGNYDFQAMDNCLEHLNGKRIAVCMGPLLRFNNKSIPQWLKKQGNDFEKIREAAYEFVSRMVDRYQRNVHLWRVISAMNMDNCCGFNFEQVIEMTRAACLAAKSANPRSKKIVEVVQPWGEYYAKRKNTVPPLVYIDTLIQSGIGFDAFGLYLEFGKDQAGMRIRDMMQISSRLDCFLPVPKPLHITGVCVPSQNSPEGFEIEKAGSWHGKWDQKLQAQWIESFYKIALGKLFVNTVTYSSLIDNESLQVKASGLLDNNLEPKKAFVAMAKIQKAILKKN